MKTLVRLGCGLLLLTTFSMRGDQVEMQNGDRYMGKVLAMTNNMLVVQSEILGQFTIPRDKVTRILLGTTAVTNATIGLAANSARPASKLPPLLTNGIAGAAAASSSSSQSTEQKQLIQQVQDEFLTGADPAAKSKYTELANGFLSGKLNVSDIRMQAKAAADQLRAAKKDLGDDAGFAFDGYLSILDRAKFLAGDTTGKVICVVTGNSIFSGLLPSDWDGSTAPPAGSPNYFLGLYSTTQLDMFKMKPNYANPAATQVTGPIYIDVSPFNLPCGGGDCIPQLNSTQLLDSVGDRTMYRLAYRNFGGHESLVVNHSVATNNTVGIRWYEIRSPNATPIVYQQSTYAPDLDYRWMASMAMDQSGNIAVGYSKSSAVLNPGIFYTGREAGDPLNSLRAEQTVLTGSGSQLPGDSGSNRWGDYSSLETDPVDDCTFWYTSEYLTADGTFNWRTRITSFKFLSCGTTRQKRIPLPRSHCKHPTHPSPARRTRPPSALAPPAVLARRRAQSRSATVPVLVAS